MLLYPRQRGAPDFKIVVAPRDAPQEANWRDFVAERDGRFIADATLFRDHLVLLMREMSRPHLVVFDLNSGRIARDRASTRRPTF